MIRPLLLRLAVFLAFASGGVAAEVKRWVLPPSGGPWPTVSEFRFQRGDNPAWSNPDFDDSDWPTIGRFEMPAREGIYWIRFHLRTHWQDPTRPRDTLGISVVASYEVYWDGRLIGRNGEVGRTADEEEPGIVDGTFRIPDELNGLGDHLVAMRISSHHTGFPTPTYGLTPRVAALRDYLSYRARASGFSLVAFGGALVVGLVFGLMWLLADRRPATGLFSLACFVAAAQQALQSWRGLLEYPYSWHYPRLLAITLLIALLGLLLVAFLQRFFGARGTWWRLGALVALMAALWPTTPYYNGKAAAICWCVLLTSIVIAIEAWRKRRRGAIYVLGGLILSIVGLARSPAEFLEHSFVFSSGAAMLGCVTALTLQLSDDRRAARQAQLTTARLEIELLKKNIQPHFLLNTLATIMEVIEQDPKAAVSLIEALASEFRILNRVSGEKLITLEQEIELCRAHLHVMSLRKAARCSLELHGTDRESLVPPAMFLTLIENGLTHLLPRNGEIIFELTAEYHQEFARYVLLARGERQGSPADQAARDGTGLRYIKARLEESFTGRWKLAGQPRNDGWQTTIEIALARSPAHPAPTDSVVAKRNFSTSS